MQDWSMIPLHIRCTERWKIDPNYPDDNARWWRLEEQSKREATFGPGTFSSGQSERQQKLLTYLRENGPVSGREITRDIGLKWNELDHVINGLSHRYQVYQAMRDGRTVYGVNEEVA